MTNPSSERVFIVGYGDIGRRVGRLEAETGRLVAALVRSDSAAIDIAKRGFEMVWGDLDVPVSLRRLPANPAVLYYFAPPAASGSNDSRLANMLSALNPVALPKRLVYISTSGVYGDCEGAWVTEDWPLNPSTDRARRRMAAETLIREWCNSHGIPFVLLRVPGIYGPGRLPVERIRQGIPVVREEDSPFSNRIHADDLATACLAAARLGRVGQAYNVSDGHPSTMTDYFYRVADALGLPRPPALPIVQAREVLSRGMLSFLEESKRLDNRRLVAELQVKLLYPDLAAGLAAAIREINTGR